MRNSFLNLSDRRACHARRLFTCAHNAVAGACDPQSMKPIALVGVVLIVAGLAALVYQGFTYTSRETVVDIGPIHATADREKTLPLPPIVGVVAVGAGIALVVVGGRSRG